MPYKSRHGKGKHSPRSRRRKSSRGVIATQQPRVSQTYESVAQPEVSAPSAKVPAPSVKVTTVSYPYIVTELRRIGILAGIMVVVLVVLFFILS